MKRLLTAAGLSALALAAAPLMVANEAIAAGQMAPAAAVADTTRPAADTAKDADRKPADVVAFIGVKPGQTVMDIAPGGGYWTRIFSNVVGPKGKVIGYVPAEVADRPNKPVDVVKAIATEKGHENVQAVSDPLASAPPANFHNVLDVAFTFENYHDFHDPFYKGANVDDYNKAMFLLIKPGGFYIVGDHAAKAGSGLANTNDLHRIDPATVRAEVEKAGFKFVGEYKGLASAADDHTLKVFDPTLRGKTDRFVMKFVKPK